MKKTVYLLSCALIPLFVLSGCVTTGSTGTMQYDINELKAKVRDLEKGGKPDEQQEATGMAVSDLHIKVQALTEEVRALTGRLDESQHGLDRDSLKMTENREALILRINDLETAVNQLKEQQSAEAVTAPETKVQEPENKAKDAYMKAFNTFKENNYSEARDKFQSILDNYPENAYSDNARFWIGESYYKEKNYEEAILAYEELLKQNPKSDKVPGAMLKQGLAFYELNDQETGKLILEKLISKYPKTEYAQRARKKVNPVSSKNK